MVVTGCHVSSECELVPSLIVPQSSTRFNSRGPRGLQQEEAGREKGGKLEGGGGGGAFLAKRQELLEISTFLWQGSCRGGAKW